MNKQRQCIPRTGRKVGSSDIETIQWQQAAWQVMKQRFEILYQEGDLLDKIRILGTLSWAPDHQERS